MNIVFARDGKVALFGVSTKTQDVLIRGKLIIYLEDGTVITLSDKGNYNYVDKIALAVYYLTNEELNKMKNSNINTVRYTLVTIPGNVYNDSGVYCTIQKGINL